MNTLGAKRIIVVVTGGIAAYKAPEVVRRMREAGAEVRVVMTPAAREFITPLTLQAVSGQPVRAELFDATAEAAMGHIELARWADAIVVAPASADFLARLRCGLAGDLASTLCLASEAPILVAPAMNQQMWQHPATRENLALLSGRGVAIAGPAEGSQACGEFGPGRMIEANEVVAAASALFENQRFAGRRVLITAGPTREPIDPVRYITNHSSGKMGYAVAAAMVEAGGAVTLVSGPTGLPPPPSATVVSVSTAQEMFEVVMSHARGTDVFIATAAVADYRPEAVAASKLKRNGEAMALRLLPNKDILRSVATLESPPFTVGFAAETDDVERNARVKLAQKAVDMIAANAVGGSDTGFDSDDNELLVIWNGGMKNLPRASKARIARDLVALIGDRLDVDRPS